MDISTTVVTPTHLSRAAQAPAVSLRRHASRRATSPRRTAPRSLQSVVLLRNTLTAYFRRSSYSVWRSFMIVLSVVL